MARSCSLLLQLTTAQRCFRSAAIRVEKGDTQKGEGRKQREVMKTLPGP